MASVRVLKQPLLRWSCLRSRFVSGPIQFGVSVHSDDTTVLMAQQDVGMLCVIAPPVTVAAKGDGGLVRVNAGWRSDIDSSG